MNNLAVTIDEENFKLKLMLLANKELVYKEFEFDSELINLTNIDYEKIFLLTLAPFIGKENIFPASMIYVLPDKYVSCDYLEIPSFTGKKLLDTLNLEISMRYVKSDGFKTLFTPVGENNNRSAFFAYLIQGATVNAIQSALKIYKFNSKLFSFESATKAGALMATGYLRRRESVLFADIMQNKTVLTAIKDLKLSGLSEIPYGENLLSCSADVVSAPPVLPVSGATWEQCESEKKSNARYLIRTLVEMADKLKKKYHMENTVIKVNCDNEFSNMFEGLNNKDYYFLEQINIKNKLIGDHLELYGALLNPKIYNKGLLF